jgi:7-cyano-7-deazaguanine synthase
MKQSSKAIVLLSGGQDSTTCLYWAKKNFKEVYAIGFNYGQMHNVELVKAAQIAELAGVSYKVLNVKGLLANSSLTMNTDHNQKSYLNENLPASFTSGRNLLFLTIAASIGAELGCNDIVTGVCQTDFSGYPDCRKVTMDSLQTTLSLGMGTGDYRIHTPLMYITKAETWKLAKELNCLDIIINYTMTDYNGSLNKNEWGFGDINNPATELRAKGYYEAKEKGWL